MSTHVSELRNLKLTSLTPLSRSRLLWNDFVHSASNLSLSWRTSSTHLSASWRVCALELGRAFPFPFPFVSSASSSSCASAPILEALMSFPRPAMDCLTLRLSVGRPSGTMTKRRYKRDKSSNLSRSSIVSNPELDMLMTVVRWGVKRLASSILRSGAVVCDER